MNYNNSTAANPSMLDSSAFACPEASIAVVGMACKFAGTDSLEEFWKILETGVSMCSDLPNDRFPDWRFERRSYPKNFKANSMRDVDAFDHKFFGIASREAKFMDPQQRLGLQVTYQALECAGYFFRDDSKAKDVGCYWATCMNEYHENVACHTPSAFSLTGSIRPFIAGKISHHFGWTGPAIMFDTACAASGTAIHQACRAVATGECSSAIAGATNIFISPDTFQNLAAGHFISTTGASRSFDAAGDGYCRGEGVAVIVLKRLSEALKDGDLIRGIIASTAVNQGANETSITIPHGPSQKSLYRKALKMAGLEPEDVSYVEAHGTGTPVGDPIEAESIRGVFGNTTRHTNGEKTYLGSLKSNIGHTEASSGISGLIKVLLMMQKRIIPQQALFNTLNPAIAPLEPSGIEIPTRNIPWTSHFKVACVNNYGASGTNAVMVVTQPPTPASPPGIIRAETYPVSIAAFSITSLVAYCSSLIRFVKECPADLGDIAYNLSRRTNLELPYKLCATISSKQELIHLLESSLSQDHVAVENRKRPVVLFFGGQTGKATSIPRAFFDATSIFRKHLIDCDMVLRELGCLSIFPAIFEPSPCEDMVLSHSILFSEQYASAMAWIDCGLKPARLIGHSFGQYAAMCVSGMVSLEDALFLVTSRARLIKESWGADPGSMIAIEASMDKVSALLRQNTDLELEIACYNGPTSFVLAGATASVDALETTIKSTNPPLPHKRLQIQHAFHSRLVEPIVGPLEDSIRHLRFEVPELPFEACSKDSTWKIATPELVASHTRDPVYFHEAVERISGQLGPCVWLEAGPGSCATMLRRALGLRASSHEIKSLNLDHKTTVLRLAEITVDLWTRGLNIQFWSFHHGQQLEYSLLNLPPYHFDKSYHWLEWRALGAPAGEILHQAQGEESLLLQLRERLQDGGGEFIIDRNCEAWRTACQGNSLLGTNTCPLSFLLDTITKAIGVLDTPSTQEATVREIQNLVLQSPILADGDSGLLLTIAHTVPSESWMFTVKSYVGKHPLASGILSTGNVGTDNDFTRLQRLVRLDHIGKLARDAKADAVKGKAVYKCVSDLVQIPSSRQCIREVALKGDEAVGYLNPLSGNTFNALENIVQIPSICLNGLRDRPENGYYCYSSIGDVKLGFMRMSDLALENISCAVYIQLFTHKDSEMICDIFVFNETKEELLIVILDLKFTRISIQSVQHSLGANVSSSFLATSNSVPNPSRPKDSVHPVEASTVNSEPSYNGCALTPPSEKRDSSTALFDLLVRVADLDSETLRSDVLVTNLGIDSLMGMEVVEEINKTFSTKIDIGDFTAANDLGSLCELIAKDAIGFSCHSEKISEAPYGSIDTVDLSASLATSVPSDVGYTSVEGSSTNIAQLPCELTEANNSWKVVAAKAFERIRWSFDDFAKKAGCDQFWAQVYPSQEDLIITYIIEAFLKVGCNLASMKEGEKVEISSCSPKQAKLTNRLLRALQDNGLVNKADTVWIRTSKPISQGAPSSEKFKTILKDFPKFASEHELLHSVGSKLDECLFGTLNPISLLFGNPEKRKLMADQYLIAPIQSSVSRQLSSFIKEYLESQIRRRPFRVLEVGAGTCGTTLYVVEMLKQLGISVEYTFSDVSQSFILAAKHKLNKYSFVHYRTLDITMDPCSELIENFDLIIATNVIHATPDVCESVRNIRQMLRPGGILTLVEYTRSLYLLDIIFGQLDGWWAFEDGREHAIMDEHGWEEVLKRAGFEQVSWSGGDSRESEILRIILAY